MAAQRREIILELLDSSVVDLDPDPIGSEPFCRIWIWIRIIGSDTNNWFGYE